MSERRTSPRRKFSFYMRVLDDDTQAILGHMVEVSAVGLQLETTMPLPLQKDYYLRLELSPDVASRPVMVFIARTKWCRMDEIEPNLYHVGFEIVRIEPHDHEIYQRLLEIYGQ